MKEYSMVKILAVMSWKFVLVWFSWLLSHLNCCTSSVPPSERVKMSWSVSLKLLRNESGGEATQWFNHWGNYFYKMCRRVRWQRQNEDATFPVTDHWLFYSLNIAFRVKQKDIQAFVLRTSSVMTKRDFTSVLRLISRPSGRSVE